MEEETQLQKAVTSFKVLEPYSDNLSVLAEFVPSEASSNPNAYLALVADRTMGRDKSGKPRSFGDFLMLMTQAKRTGLDPISRQIMPVYRYSAALAKDVMAIQVSIDGFRLVAQRSGLYAGSTDVEYDSEDGEHPKKATITVFKINDKNGERMPITASARWDEYCPKLKDGKPSGLWKQMPYLMLGKVAEALALRKAFPLDLSGLYTEEEMDQANPKPSVGKVTLVNTAEAAQIAAEAISKRKKGE
jgi:phage recombination protein Bet